MRLRAARLSVGAISCVAIAAAAFFLVQSEKEIAGERADFRTFDRQSREAADAVAELRAGQEAYVAAGQGVAFWMPKVAATSNTAATLIAGLRAEAKGADARASLDEAAGSITEFDAVDKRVRDYITSDQALMAADVVFTEGVETSAAAMRQVEASRLAERQAFDASEAAARELEAIVAGASAALAVLTIALFVPSGRAHEGTGVPASHATLDLRAPAPAPKVTAEPATGASARAVLPTLKAAAQLCTEFGRVNDTQGVTAALARAADLMGASGLIVWLGSAAGADLKPVLAHGYTPQMLARIPTVPRSADNAAAAAYRAGAMQIVLARPGSSNGAIVAPLLSPEGCIGALSAEIAGGGETSDSVQALAAIIAAQLAGVFSASTTPAANNDARTAAERA